MPRMRDLLQRFRPTSAPGAASAGGVPADRAADLAAELRPVMDALAGTQTECRTLLEEAEAAAAAIRSQGLQEAGRIRASAPERAAAERARIASSASQRSRAEIDAEAAEARRVAGQVTAHARALLPGYVESVVAATELR